MGQENLRKFMKERGWAVEKMAVECKVSFMTVYRWLNGKSKPSRLAQEKIKQVTGQEW